MTVDGSVLRLARGVAFGLALLAAPVARAEGVSPADATASQKRAATDHFLAGRRALEARSLDKAVLELEASLAIVNSPNARLELARALRDTGEAQKARGEYGRVIADATALAAREVRYQTTADTARTELAEIDAQLAFVTVAIAHAPPGSILKVGGRIVAPGAWGAPIATAPGAIDVVLTAAGGEELARQTVEAIPGQTATVSFDAPAPPPAPGPLPAPAPSPDSSSNLRTYAYVAGGAGVAGLAVFAIFGVMSNGDYNDLKQTCVAGTSGQVCPPSKAGEIQSGQTDQTAANVGLTVGLAGVAAGATLFVLSLSGHPGSASGLLIGPGYVGFAGAL